RGRQRFGVGHVAGNKLNFAELLFLHDLAHPPAIIAQVVNPDRLAALNQVLGDPAADATETAGDEDAHEGHFLDWYRGQPTASRCAPELAGNSVRPSTVAAAVLA